MARVGDTIVIRECSMGKYFDDCIPLNEGEYAVVTREELGCS